MIKGLVEVDKRQFSKMQGRIKTKIDTVENNWAEGKKDCCLACKELINA